MVAGKPTRVVDAVGRLVRVSDFARKAIDHSDAVAAEHGRRERVVLRREVRVHARPLPERQAPRRDGGDGEPKDSRPWASCEVEWVEGEETG